MAGVYQIYNKETNKRYIGSSINIERRLKEHKRNLKANRHSNQHLQNAHMNQLREYMFQNGMISTRGQTVDAKMMKKVLDQISKTDSMKEVARASRQFNNINKYTKWFNSIPLLGVGALGVYSNENNDNQ